jgi:hypothetical protein
MAKAAQLFTVRNDAGQQVGTYYALTPAQAIARFHAGQNAYTSVFRSHGRRANARPIAYTAAVEPPVVFNFGNRS